MGIKSEHVSSKSPQSFKKTQPRFDGVTMPDFRGLLLSESLNILTIMQKKYPVSYSFMGNGRVYAQSPEFGTPLTNQKIILYLREN
jgi:hypothetical protein